MQPINSGRRTITVGRTARGDDTIPGTEAENEIDS